MIVDLGCDDYTPGTQDCYYRASGGFSRMTINSGANEGAEAMAESVLRQLRNLKLRLFPAANRVWLQFGNSPLRSWLGGQFRRIPMPLLAIIVGLVCGVVVWEVLDHVQPRALQKIFTKELKTRLNQQARESLIRFDNYVEAHTSTTRLLANHRQLSSYLDPIYWYDYETPPPAVYYRTPPWLPPAELWQALVAPGQVLLIDKSGHTREIYNLTSRPLPQELLTVDSRFLSESRVQAYLTALGQRPYLLISEIMEDGTGTDMGYLMMVVPIDSEFLRASQQGTSASGAVVGVIDADEQRFLAASDPERVVPGSSLDQAADSFVVTAQSFFAYEGSNLNLQFATLIPLSSVEATHKRVEGVERRQRLISGATFILVFTLVFYLMSEWLNRILRRISLFSRQALGKQQPLLEKGNQLFVLENWVKHFIGNVLNSREEMRRVHETEMQASEALKRAIMEAALDPIVTIDEHIAIVEFNSTAERIFGHRRNSVIALGLVPLIIREDDRDKLAKLIENLQENSAWQDQETRGEMMAVKSDGSLFPVEVSVKPLQLERRKLYTIYLRDITNRKRAEEKISSLAKFPAESPSPILRVNLPGVVIYANPASSPLMEYWGCEQGQTLPLYWRKRIVKVFESGYDWEAEVSFRNQNYSLLMTPVIELGYVNIYGRDITEVRKAEGVAREHQQELVHVCRLSTMGEMATGLAHELNQPLSAIANYANGCVRRLKLEERRSDDLIYAMDQINSQAARAGEIIRRLRQLVGKHLPVRSVVDVNNLVREVCSFVEFEARKAEVVIEQQLSFDRLPVRADLVQIEQVLLNLVRNALDALHEVPVEVRSLVIRTGFQGGDKIQVDVIDSGSGISEEVAEQLFQPFFTTKSGGMGMGLVISQSIIEDHKGSIEARQVSNGGSCFSITLPAYRDSKPEEKK